MSQIGMTFSCYFFVFITIIDRVIYIGIYYFNEQNYVLQVPLPVRDVNNIILRPINFFTYFFDICHKHMLICNNIKFGQLSVK